MGLDVDNESVNRRFSPSVRGNLAGKVRPDFPIGQQVLDIDGHKRPRPPSRNDVEYHSKIFFFYFVRSFHFFITFSVSFAYMSNSRETISGSERSVGQP